MQYIPTSAWRVNITQRYGRGAVGVVSRGTKQRAPFIADQQEPTETTWRSGGDDATQPTAILRRLYAQQVPFIDLRDPVEAELAPVPHATALHHHDLLSGACCGILPEDKRARIVVFASGRQRAVNGFNALRRHGYHNVTVADAAVVTASVAAQPAGGRRQ
jgi:rhodanese-related sulfurtransferase